VGFWTYTPGSHKSLKLLSDMPMMKGFSKVIAGKVRDLADGKELRLLETIVFSKPPEISNTLRWHQDVSYFPFEPNNQIAVWIPFDVVTKESGAMVYALGSHKLGLRASTDLHTGEVFSGDDRPLIDVEGLETRCMEMEPGDMLIHDGRTWHTTGPNTVVGRQRRGLSFRFLVGETRYKPRAGSSATFLKQTADIRPGDLINDPAFPVL
jgi:ectoine hydroxylase-related dioxygenase (phytanoyl-CoA dioxygenase family)